MNAPAIARHKFITSLVLPLAALFLFLGWGCTMFLRYVGECHSGRVTYFRSHWKLLGAVSPARRICNSTDGG